MSKKKTKDEVIIEFQSIWGDRFDYSLVDYKTTNDRVQIICKVHGIFTLIPYQHKSGAGCRKCGKITGRPRKTTIDFIEKSKKLFGDRFDYSETVYTHALADLVVICKKHSAFTIQPHRHFESGGCPYCCRQSSIQEKVWLDSLGLPDHPSYRNVDLQLGGKCLVDGFNPETNTVYEFHGDFWHGNPKIYSSSDVHPIINKTYGELYERTMKKDQLIRDNGYQLVTIWSSDWKAS